MLPALPPIGISDLKLACLQGRKVFLREVPQYPKTCSNCGGMGALWFQYVVSGPYKGVPHVQKEQALAWQPEGWYVVESNAYECPLCHDPAQRIAHLWKTSGLELALRDYSLEHIQNMADKQYAYAAAVGVRDTIPNPSGWMLFYGDYGRGKTGILAALVVACIRAGCPARYVRAVDILAEIRETYGDDAMLDEHDVLTRYGGMRLLAIDEVEKTSQTAWAVATLMSILDTRYMRRDQQCTILASNLAPDMFPKALGYLASRIKDAEQVEVTGAEMRGKYDVEDI
jgi:DNA replication protein DnaC